MINPAYLTANKLAELTARYKSNTPFPNIYLDNFFEQDFLKGVLEEFPDLQRQKNAINFANPNEAKWATKGEHNFGAQTLSLVHYLNSAPFLQFLQKITGIKECLIPDPYFEGGGFHEIKPQGFLKIHVDFHKHRSMKLSRRLNLLVYLNEDWDESYGGHFELWEKDMSKCAKKILPIFNRVAIFSTTGDSWHGHPDPLNCPSDRSRKSLAVYYYTNGRPVEELDRRTQQRITTTFVARKGQEEKKMIYYNQLVRTANHLLPPRVVEFIKSFRKS